MLDGPLLGEADPILGLADVDLVTTPDEADDCAELRGALRTGAVAGQEVTRAAGDRAPALLELAVVALGAVQKAARTIRAPDLFAVVGAGAVDGARTVAAALRLAVVDSATIDGAVLVLALRPAGAIGRGAVELTGAPLRAITG